MYVVDLAVVAYEAYSKSTGNKNFRGEEMPAYKDLPDNIKEAWRAATQAVAKEVAVQIEQGHTVVGE